MFKIGPSIPHTFFIVVASLPPFPLDSSLPPAVVGRGASDVLIALAGIRANSPSHASSTRHVLPFHTLLTLLLRISSNSSTFAIHHPYSSSTPVLRAVSYRPTPAFVISVQYFFLCSFISHHLEVFFISLLIPRP